MPPPTQRRNTAYLNPLIERPAAWTGLAIDLGGSVNFCFRPADLAGGFDVAPRHLSAAAAKRWDLRRSSQQPKRFVRSNG
jgi:hypothetical protein